MTAGLQVWNAHGQIMLEVTDRLTRVLGSLNTGESNGSVSHPGFSSGAPWFFVASPVVLTTRHALPVVSIAGNTLSWVFDLTPTPPPFSQPVIPFACNVVYGVY